MSNQSNGCLQLVFFRGDFQNADVSVCLEQDWDLNAPFHSGVILVFNLSFIEFEGFNFLS